MNKEMNEDWSDIVAIVQEDRNSRLPRYGSFIESVFGEMRRISEQKIRESAVDEEERIRRILDKFYEDEGI